MTLILSCATPDYVVQVSDRRLTAFYGKQTEDHENKVTFFCGKMAFGYTGLAMIGTTKTDKWITQLLADPNYQSVSDACFALQNGATEAFRRMHPIKIPKKIRRHAFVGTGWVQLSGVSDYQPIICTISNAQNDEGEWLTEPKDFFELRYIILQEPGFFLFESTGQSITPKEKSKIIRLLRACFKHKTGPEPVARILVKAIREVAAKHRTVGKNLLVASIPRAALGATRSLYTTALPSRETSTFTYIPADCDTALYNGPNFVCGGSGAITNFTARTIKPGERGLFD